VGFFVRLRRAAESLASVVFGGHPWFVALWVHTGRAEGTERVGPGIHSGRLQANDPNMWLIVLFVCEVILDSSFKEVFND
jgi:hypothetical protein